MQPKITPRGSQLRAILIFVLYWGRQWGRHQPEQDKIPADLCHPQNVRCGSERMA